MRGLPTVLSDPSGKYAYLWHGAMTFVASMSAGNGVVDSASYAWDSMAADFGYVNGHPSQSVENANMHGMTKPGQSVADAMRGNADFVAQQVANGRLGYAAHALQDPFAPDHGYQAWDPSNMSLNDWFVHLIRDTFPVSPSAMWVPVILTVEFRIF